MADQQTVNVCWVRLTKVGHVQKEHSKEPVATLPHRGARKFFGGVAHEVIGTTATPHLDSKYHIFVAEQ